MSTNSDKAHHVARRGPENVQMLKSLIGDCVGLHAPETTRCPGALTTDGSDRLITRNARVWDQRTYARPLPTACPLVHGPSVFACDVCAMMVTDGKHIRACREGMQLIQQMYYEVDGCYEHCNSD